MKQAVIDFVDGTCCDKQSVQDFLTGLRRFEEEIKNAQHNGLVGINFESISSYRFNLFMRIPSSVYFFGQRSEETEVDFDPRSLSLILPVFPCITFEITSPNIRDGRMIIPWGIGDYSRTMHMDSFFPHMIELGKSKTPSSTMSTTVSTNPEVVRMWLRLLAPHKPNFEDEMLARLEKVAGEFSPPTH